LGKHIQANGVTISRRTAKKYAMQRETMQRSTEKATDLIIVVWVAQAEAALTGEADARASVQVAAGRSCDVTSLNILPRRSALHSMTLSARSSSEGGMVRPRALAVLILMTRSNFVGRSTGNSVGFAPLRILSAISAARRNIARMLAP